MDLLGSVHCLQHQGRLYMREKGIQVGNLCAQQSWVPILVAFLRTDNTANESAVGFLAMLPMILYER